VRLLGKPPHVQPKNERAISLRSRIVGAWGAADREWEPIGGSRTVGARTTLTHMGGRVFA
jgi:hypothetical protein